MRVRGSRPCGNRGVHSHMNCCDLRQDDNLACTHKSWDMSFFQKASVVLPIAAETQDVVDLRLAGTLVSWEQEDPLYPHV